MKKAASEFVTVEPIDFLLISGVRSIRRTFHWCGPRGSLRSDKMMAHWVMVQSTAIMQAAVVCILEWFRFRGGRLTVLTSPSFFDPEADVDPEGDHYQHQRKSDCSCNDDHMGCAVRVLEVRHNAYWRLHSWDLLHGNSHHCRIYYRPQSPSRST